MPSPFASTLTPTCGARSPSPLRGGLGVGVFRAWRPGDAADALDEEWHEIMHVTPAADCPDTAKELYAILAVSSSDAPAIRCGRDEVAKAATSRGSHWVPEPWARISTALATENALR